jgi:hypothetical protein
VELRQQKSQPRLLSVEQKLALRMPTRLYDSFMGKLARDIDRQLYLIVSGGGPSSQFAKDVDDRFFAFPYSLSENHISRHEPDSSFYH